MIIEILIKNYFINENNVNIIRNNISEIFSKIVYFQIFVIYFIIYWLFLKYLSPFYFYWIHLVPYFIIINFSIYYYECKIKNKDIKKNKLILFKIGYYFIDFFRKF